MDPRHNTPQAAKQAIARRVKRIERIIIADREPSVGAHDDEIVIIDLLADLRFYCRRFNYNFDKLDAVAGGHFLIELAIAD